VAIGSVLEKRLSIIVYDERGRTLFTKPVGTRRPQGLHCHNGQHPVGECDPHLRRPRANHFLQASVSAISQKDCAAEVDGGPAPKVGAAADAGPDTRPPPDAP